MSNLIATIFSSDGFMPHGHCYLWQPAVLWLHVISDSLIALAYYSIPITLIYFVRKRKDLAFHWMFICFAVFILACGATHLMEIWNVWHPNYWLSGGIKALTALASIPTAILLVKLIPMALALPSPSTLKLINEQMENEIIERKQIEQSLHEKNIELENANLAKNRFLANMSHELRTPLNAIIGFTGTLLMKLPGPLTSDQEKQLNTVRRSAMHLLSLINDLLDLAKITSGKVDIHFEPVACAGVIQEVATTLGPLAEKKGLAFEVVLPPEDVVIRTDRRALSQVIINLASNGIKYTEQGKVCLTLARRLINGAMINEISVSDTGRGIGAEDQARLFQAFTQLDSSSTRHIEGTGLGLHLSQKLANILGGHIVCQSEFGKGSTFTLAIAEK